MEKPARSNVRLGDAWEEARLFLGREVQLVAPLAFAFFGLPAIVLGMAMPGSFQQLAQAPAGRLVPVLAGVLVVTLFGQLALSALVLTPGGSVGEALARARDRFAALIGAALMLAGGALALAVVAALLVAIAAGGSGGVAAAAPATGASTAAAAWAVLLMMLPILFFGVRMMTLPALVADREAGPWPALLATFRMTRPIFWRLLLAWIGFTVVTQLITAAVGWALGAVVLLFGEGSELRPFVDLLLALIGAVVVSVASAFWTVFLARLYLRLSGEASSGI